MTVSITIARNRKGDDEVHRAGCQHLRRRDLTVGEGSWGTFSGETLIEAISAADDDMADAFGQDVYHPDPSDQPWTVSVMTIAPCFENMIGEAGISFDRKTGKPQARA